MQFHLGKILAGLFIALLLNGCASGPKYFDPKGFSSDKKAYMERYTDSQSSKYVAKAKKVVIPNFYVEFLVKTSGGSSKSDWQSGSSVSTSVSYNLKGVSEQTMREITNQLYDKMVANLKSSGYEVVPQSALEKNTNFKALIAKYGKKTPHLDEAGLLEKDGKSLLFTARSMPLYFSTSGSGSDKKMGFFESISQVGDAFKGQAAANFEGAIMHDFEAAIIKPRFVVGFALIEGSSSSGFNSISASVKSEMNINIAAQASKIEFLPEYTNSGDIYVPTATGQVFLKEPMIANDNIATSVVDVTSVGTKVTTGVLNVLGALSSAQGGRGSSISITEYDATMNESAYKTAAIQNLNAAAELLVLRAKSVQ
ncbi:MAG: hypothetical protein WC742_05920 [Gallionellaceae bacterium]|jgi:hypothetical protein